MPLGTAPPSFASSTFSAGKRSAFRLLRVTATLLLPANPEFGHEIPLRPSRLYARNIFVQTEPTPIPVQAFAPDFARRLRLILTTLAALIARRFLREPRLAALIVPLWSRLQRAARRFERLMVGLAAGHLPKPRASGPGGPHRSAGQLPTGRGWLVRALGPEAAACATQLQALLAEPAAAELLALAPTARRILRPLARMLAIGPFAPRPRPVRAAPNLPPLREVAIRSPGFTWYVVSTPPTVPA